MESGKYPQALVAVETLPAIPDVFAVRGMALLMSSRTEEAWRVALKIESGRSIFNAYGSLILGHCERRRGNQDSAIKYLEFAQSLFKFHGIKEEYLKTDSILVGLCRNKLIDINLDWIIENLTGIGDNSAAIILNNYGDAFSSLGKRDIAIEVYVRALSYEVENLDLLATIHNNLGVQYHITGQRNLAHHFYCKAMDLSCGSGNFRMFGIVNCNLSEIYGDLNDFSNCIDLLRINGEDVLADKIMDNIMARLFLGA